MPAQINMTVLMSDAQHFDDGAAINPYMDSSGIDRVVAQSEHDNIRQALQSAGVTVKQVVSPAGCQDGVYTANWALVRGDTAVLASLPNVRKAEESYAEQVLRAQGKTVVKVPNGLRFSGQGDALPCGNYLFCGSTYRSDPEVHTFLAQTLGYDIVSLQTIPQLDASGQPAINAVSGWPDSFGQFAQSL